MQATPQCTIGHGTAHGSFNATLYIGDPGASILSNALFGDGFLIFAQSLLWMRVFYACLY
jgi:hypothetical protein